jgi:hypothetical protein
LISISQSLKNFNSAGFRDSIRILHEKGFNPKIPFCRPIKNKKNKSATNGFDETSENDGFDSDARLTVDQTSASRQATKVFFMICLI